MSGWQEDLDLSHISSFYWSQRQESEQLRVPQLERQCSAESEPNCLPRVTPGPGTAHTYGLLGLMPPISPGCGPLLENPGTYSCLPRPLDSPASWCFPLPCCCSRRWHNAVPRGLACSPKARVPGLADLCGSVQVLPSVLSLGKETAGLGYHSCPLVFFSVFVKILERNRPLSLLEGSHTGTIHLGR